MSSPIAAQALKELMGIENIVVRDFRLQCQPFSVTSGPFTDRLRTTLFGSWCSPNDGHPQGMTATIAGYSYNQDTWLFSE